MQLSDVVDMNCARALADLYANRLHRGADGSQVEIDAETRIAPEAGLSLARLIREAGCRTAVETGFAYGFSTLFILGALKLNAGDAARHRAIDPAELSSWGGVGLRKVEEAGCSGLFEWIAAPSLMGFADLLRAEARADLVFVDGDHHFEGVVLDIACGFRMLPLGGILVLDDAWMPAVRGACAFARANLPLAGLETGVPDMVAYRKVGEDLRPWYHFAPFEAPRDRGAPPRPFSAPPAR